MLSFTGKINARLLAKLKTDDDAPYFGKALNFTSVSSGTPASFPTLAVFSLGEPDAESTFEHDKQEAVWVTIELRSYSNVSLNDAIKLLGMAGDVMYGMFFDKTYENTLSDIKPFCRVARYRRKVGSADKLY